MATPIGGIVELSAPYSATLEAGFGKRQCVFELRDRPTRPSNCLSQIFAADTAMGEDSTILVASIAGAARILAAEQILDKGPRVAPAWPLLAALTAGLVEFNGVDPKQPYPGSANSERVPINHCRPSRQRRCGRREERDDARNEGNSDQRGNGPERVPN
jgi:hypothetical protein